jgi:uncharacterized protein YqeY
MLRTQLTDALKDAMKAKESRAVSTLRMILAGLKDKDIAARPSGVSAIDDGQILSMMQGMIKQRRESIELYKQGGRDDLVQQESDEIAIIERFLPKQMDEAETKAAIDGAVAATGAASIKDMGKVMAELKARFAGQMDFAKAGPLVKARLGG